MATQTIQSSKILLDRFTSPDKRRKLQNRINQRAHRKRKRQGTKICSSAVPQSANDSSNITKSSYLPHHNEMISEAQNSLQSLWHLYCSAVGPQYIDHSGLERVGKLCTSKEIKSEQALTAFRHWVDGQHSVFNPRTDCLLVLVKFNVFRALLLNGRTLGFSMLIGLLNASIERRGLIIWGEPYDQSGWEDTKPFLKHSGWALRGCAKLSRATNYWRQLRGELPLKFDGIDRQSTVLAVGPIAP